MIIVDAIRRWFGKMLAKKSIEKKLDIQIATSTQMDEAVQRWFLMYQNRPPWLGGKDRVRCLNIPATVSEEMARLILTEFQMRLGGEVGEYDAVSVKEQPDTNERAAFIQTQLDTFFTNIDNIVEMWCAIGGIALKPYAVGKNPETGNPDRIAVDVVLGNRFFPTAFNSNKEVTAAVFVDTRRIGDYAYTRLEHHSLVGKHYMIINRAYRSNRMETQQSEDHQFLVEFPFMTEISLESVDEWMGLQPIVELDDVEEPLFVYIKTPRANNVDPYSPLGVSIYSRAEGVIEELDRQYTRILREYRVKEAFIQADETLFIMKVTATCTTTLLH